MINPDGIGVKGDRKKRSDRSNSNPWSNNISLDSGLPKILSPQRNI